MGIFIVDGAFEPIQMQMSGGHLLAAGLTASTPFTEKRNDAVQEPQRGVPSDGSLANATSAASTNNLSDGETSVKEKFSITATEKRGIASDLRNLLSRAETLRSYGSTSGIWDGSGILERVLCTYVARKWNYDVDEKLLRC